MRTRFLLGLIVASTGWLAGCSGEFDASDRQAIAAVIAAQSEAWNRGDLEGFMAGYERSPDLVFTSGAKIRRGWEHTLATFRDRYGQDTSSMGKLAFEVLEIRPVGTEGAVVLGNWRLTDTDNAGSGVFSLVFERGPDGWLIVHDHTSAAAKPESEPEDR